MAETEAEMDLGMEDFGADDMEAGDEEGAMMMAEDAEELASALEDFSDDEIIAEMKLRGLTVDLSEEDEEDMEEEDDISEPGMVTGDI